MPSLIDEYESLVNRRDFKTNKAAQKKAAALRAIAPVAYGDIVSSPGFGSSSSSQQLAHRMREAGLVVDPTQGGLVAPPPARTTGAFGLPTTPNVTDRINNNLGVGAAPIARPKAKPPMGVPGVAKPPSISSLTDDLLPGGMSGGQTQRSTPAPQKVKPQPSTVVSNNKKWTGTANLMNGIPGSPIYEMGRQLGLDVAYRPVKGGITKARYGGPTGPVQYFGSAEEGGRLLDDDDPRVRAIKAGGNRKATPTTPMGNGQTAPAAVVSNRKATLAAPVSKGKTGTANPKNGIVGSDIYNDSKLFGDVIDRPVIDGITQATFTTIDPKTGERYRRYYGNLKEHGRRLDESDQRVQNIIHPPLVQHVNPDGSISMWPSETQDYYDSYRAKQAKEGEAYKADLDRRGGMRGVVVKGLDNFFAHGLSELGTKVGTGAGDALVAINPEHWINQWGLQRAKEQGTNLPDWYIKLLNLPENTVKGTAKLLAETPGFATSNVRAGAAYGVGYATNNQEAMAAGDEFGMGVINAARGGEKGWAYKLQHGDVTGAASDLGNAFLDNPAMGIALLHGGIRGGLRAGEIAADGLEAGSRRSLVVAEADAAAGRQAKAKIEFADALKQQKAAANIRHHINLIKNKVPVFGAPTYNAGHDRSAQPAPGIRRTVGIENQPKLTPKRPWKGPLTEKPVATGEFATKARPLQPNREEALQEAPANAGASSGLEGTGVGRAAGDTLPHDAVQDAQGFSEAGKRAQQGDPVGAMEEAENTLINSGQRLINNPLQVVQAAKAAKLLRDMQTLAAKQGDLKTAHEMDAAAQGMEKRAGNLRKTRQQLDKKPGAAGKVPIVVPQPGGGIPGHPSALGGGGVPGTPPMPAGGRGSGVNTGPSSDGAPAGSSAPLGVNQPTGPMGGGLPEQPTGAIRTGEGLPGDEGMPDTPGMRNEAPGTDTAPGEGGMPGALPGNAGAASRPSSIDAYLDNKHVEAADAKSRAIKATADAQTNPKGYVEFQADGRAMIKALRGADASTALHETFHVARRNLNAEQTAILEEWAGVKDGQWTPEAEEMAARAWEQYLREGVAPTRPLQAVFARLKAVLSDIYHGVRGSDIEISPQVRNLFDELLGKGEAEGMFGRERSPWGERATGKSPHGIRDAATYYSAMKKAFHLSSKDAHMVTSIADSMATQWARRTGRPKSEWYEKIAYIERGAPGEIAGPVGPNRLYQDPKGVPRTDPNVVGRGKVGPDPDVLHWLDTVLSGRRSKIAVPIWGAAVKYGRYKNPKSGVEHDVNSGFGAHADPHYQKHGFVWSNSTAGTAKALINALRDSDGLGFYHKMGPGAIMSDPNYWHIYVKEVNAALKKGELEKEAHAKLNNGEVDPENYLTPEKVDTAIRIAMRKAKLTKKLSKVTPSGKNGLYTIEDIDGLKNLTFTQRTNFLKVLGGNPENKGIAEINKSLHTPSNFEIVPLLDMFPDAKPGDIVGAAQFDRTQLEPIHGPAVGIPEMSYDYYLRGTHLGYAKTPIPFGVAYGHLFKASKKKNVSTIKYKARLLPRYFIPPRKLKKYLR